MLTGMSFDDVAPAANVAKMMALMESMVSMFYIAILISRLVALHTTKSATK